MNPCHATCCDHEQTEQFQPFCSENCRKLTRLVVAAGYYGPSKGGNGTFIPPPVAPFSWLDARATSQTQGGQSP